MMIVHSTHEAGIKMGGIGAVLDHLLSAQPYIDKVARTVLVGPMDTGSITEMERLAESVVKIRYSSHHGIDELDISLSTCIGVIEQRYNVSILYGVRAFGLAEHEIILVDARHINPAWVNAYKSSLYHKFGIQSDRYERESDEYNFYINAAEPAFRVLEAVIGETANGPRFMIAHEFMGMPLCYSAMLHSPDKYISIFYGHEVASVRPIVEYHPGHDIMFYKVMRLAKQKGLYLKNMFNDPSGFFKHSLIYPAAAHCDNIFAVSGQVLGEMRFLDLQWKKVHIDLVYNGVLSEKITLRKKAQSKNKLKDYCKNLLGYEPDYVFTHVTRCIPSKGLWRDIRVMEHLAPQLADKKKSAVLFVLASSIPEGRPAKAIEKMENDYGWPVYHREQSVLTDGAYVPDLLDHEAAFYKDITQFNMKYDCIKIVLINQFGWSRERCGNKMPENMEFMDIRSGTDLEFGQSVYEPFGIAQLEPLTYGALCVVSSTCGCSGFVKESDDKNKNIIIADYIGMEHPDQKADIENAIKIDADKREQIESVQAEKISRDIMNALPKYKKSAQKILEQGYALSRKMSWEVVVTNYFFKGLNNALARKNITSP
ncbi:MAG: glycogen synthase [Gammaproteobacteria bacterium]|nr:glycogen synthase [Gammaproteobacteria bacterium]